MKTPSVWLLTGMLCLLSPKVATASWTRHTIDNSSRGADGIRLADINGDGLLDVATGWEEGGLVRVYLHPGFQSVKMPWPKVTVGHVSSPEDAVLMDIDGDAAWDVISSCEGRTKSIFVHWAPPPGHQYSDEARWTTAPIPQSVNAQLWMFALPMGRVGNSYSQLLVGSKGKSASISICSLPENRRRLDQWRFHSIYEAGWIMSLRRFDVDRDGDQDVVVSDRKGKKSGVLWLENPGHTSNRQDPGTWTEHRIGAAGKEVMFLDIIPGENDEAVQVAVYAKPNQVFQWTLSADRKHWKKTHHNLKANIGTAKAVRYADLDNDGSLDLVASCEHARDGRSGVFWFPLPPKSQTEVTHVHDISGPRGIKFDRLEVLDLDGDGDLDVMTCEENENLGVIWYENPIR